MSFSWAKVQLTHPHGLQGPWLLRVLEPGMGPYTSSFLTLTLWKGLTSKLVCGMFLLLGLGRKHKRDPVFLPGCSRCQLASLWANFAHPVKAVATRFFLLPAVTFLLEGIKSLVGGVLSLGKYSHTHTHQNKTLTSMQSRGL